MGSRKIEDEMNWLSRFFGAPAADDAADEDVQCPGGSDTNVDGVSTCTGCNRPTRDCLNDLLGDIVQEAERNTVMKLKLLKPEEVTPGMWVQGHPGWWKITEVRGSAISWRQEDGYTYGFEIPEGARVLVGVQGP